MNKLQKLPQYPVELGRAETVIIVDDRDFEAVVRSVYGISDYRFASVEECDNHTSHRFDVSTRTVYEPGNACDAHTLTQLEKVLAGRVPPGCNYVIMQDLVNRGVLRPAIYLVEVFW